MREKTSSFRARPRKKERGGKKMNINDFVKPRPCYGLEKIEAKIEANLVAIAGAREFWTALGILRLAEDIPSHYRLWAVLREPLISAKTLHLFACNVAEQELLNAENTDARSWDAISAKRLWLAHQATDEELSAACSAASDAVFAACTSAAPDAVFCSGCSSRIPACGSTFFDAACAALDAAGASPRDAAYDASYASARAKARVSSKDAACMSRLSKSFNVPCTDPDAARVFARDAAYEAQCQMLINLLNGQLVP